MKERSGVGKSIKKRESDRRKGVCLKASSSSRGRATRSSRRCWQKVRSARKLKTRTQALCVSLLEFHVFAPVTTATLTGEKNERKKEGGETKERGVRKSLDRV